MPNGTVTVNKLYVKWLTGNKQPLTCEVCSRPFKPGDTVYSKRRGKPGASGSRSKRGRTRRRYHLSCWNSLFH